jgi:heme A synthase
MPATSPAIARPDVGRSASMPLYARYAWGVLAFNLLVILWGGFVRASGSGAGCGSHWPLCNGEVVPRAPAVATVIEFGHRVSSGLSLLLIAGLVVGAWRRYPRRHRVRLGAALSGAFILGEALIGAGLVLLEHVATDTSLVRGYWVSGHLVNTFLLVASLALTAWWALGGPPPRLRGRGALAALIGAALAALLVLGVSGAITALGDTLFPVTTLAEGEALTFSDSAHLFVRLRIWHPTLAVAVGVWLGIAVFSALRARPTPAVRRLAGGLAGLYAVQLGLGVLNVWLLAPLAIQMIHLLLSDLIWIAFVLLAATVLAAAPRPVGAAPLRRPLPR